MRVKCLLVLMAMLYLVALAVPVFAACVQAGQVYQMTVRGGGLPAAVWVKPGQGNTFYSFSTTDPTLQAVLAGWVGQRVTFYGDAAACPDAGPVRDAGKLTAVSLAE